MMTDKSTEIYLKELGHSIKAKKFIVLKFSTTFVNHILFCNNTRLYMFVRIFTTTIEIVLS